MGTIFAYFIQSSICLALFYLFYKVLLSRETFHRFNRIGLLGILVLSLTVPCILTLFRLHHEAISFIDPDMQNLIGDFFMSGDIISGEIVPDDVKSQTGNLFLSFLLIVYITGCLINLLYAILSTVRIGYIIKKGTCLMNDNGMNIILLDDTTVSPFSWMKYIVLSKSDYETVGDAIIAHETAHIRLHHSLDLIVAQICILMQWFNPAAWLLYRELQNIHEYEADDAVINRGIDAKQYQLLLIKKAVGARLYSVANSLNHSNLKKRITMMRQKKSNPWARLKYAYVLPLAAVTVAVFAHPEISQPFEEISNAKVSHFALETSKNEVKDLPETEIFVTPSNSLETVNLQDTVSQDINFYNQVFNFYHVEQMPEYPGGNEALMKYIYDNLRYPKVAEDQGISGRVVCQFIIEKDGSISNVEIIRGVDPSLDREAIRVLKDLPNFSPGMVNGQPVRVRFSTPVVFQLMPRESESDSIIVEKVEFADANKSNSLFLVYPNPVNDVLSIDIDQRAISIGYAFAGKPANNPTCDIRLYNMSGTLVLHTTTGNAKVQLNVSKLPDGIYFLHLNDGTDSYSEVKQIVIKH